MDASQYRDDVLVLLYKLSDMPDFNDDDCYLVAASLSWWARLLT